LVGDPSAFATAQSTPTAWALGEVERARELIDWSTRRAAEIGHVPVLLNALFFKSYLELWRGDPVATLRAAEDLEATAKKHAERANQTRKLVN
jgi:hypothetical protein